MPVPAKEQTHVVVATCVITALQGYCAERCVKREPTIRALLDRYIDEQQTREPDDRLTHVSTVIWHPNMPVGRSNPSPHAARLAMRLPPSMTDTARALALHLPGQTDAEGGHHDYRPRLLADAVVTALAAEMTFTDDVLDGLPSLLTHRAARGLFRLAVAATATRPERLIYARANADLARVESNSSGRIGSDAGTEHAIALATVLRSEDVAWHGPYRRAVTRHLARELLTGEDADANLAMLHTRDRQGFEVERRLLEMGDTYRDGALGRSSRWPNDYEGRGGTAVWRAERIVQTDNMLDWLRTHTTDGVEPDTDTDYRTWHMLEPGWDLRSPTAWRAVARRIHDMRNQQRLHADVRSGTVLHLRSGGWDLYWPYRRAGDGSRALQVVPGIDTVLRAAAERPAPQVAEFILASTDPVRGLGNTHMPLHMSAFTARMLDFIDQDECDRLVAEARQTTIARMQTWLDRVPRTHADLRDQLTAAMESPTAFGRIVTGMAYRRAVGARWDYTDRTFYETRTAVPWPRDPTDVVAELAVNHDPGTLKWVSGALFRYFDAALEASMQHAWHQAIHGYRVTSVVATDPPRQL